MSEGKEDKMVKKRLDRLLGHAGIMLFVAAHFSKVAEKIYILVASWLEITETTLELLVLYILGSILFSSLYVLWAKIEPSN